MELISCIIGQTYLLSRRIYNSLMKYYVCDNLPYNRRMCKYRPLPMTDHFGILFQNASRRNHCYDFGLH